MLWEYVMPPIVTSLVYIVIPLALSWEYESFLRNRGLRKRDALVLIGYSVCIAFLYLVVVWFLHMGNIVLISHSTLVLGIIVLLVLLPVIVKIRKIVKNAVLKTYKLDGEKVEYYAYSGSDVSAFYRDGKIYVHEALEELLSEDELKAVIYHEQKHREQSTRRPYSVALKLTYYAVSYWILAGLVIAALANHIVSSIVLFPGAVLGNVLAVVSALVAIYLMLALFSLIVVYLRWVWEHDADLYAAGKVGAEVFAKALVKVYLAKYLADAARYVSLEGFSADFKLGDVPPLTWRDVFRELLRRTLSPQGLVNAVSIVIKPLEETHPPLHLRLRAVRTAI